MCVLLCSLLLKASASYLQNYYVCKESLPEIVILNFQQTFVLYKVVLSDNFNG